MGIVNSRYNIDELDSSRRRSQAGEAVYSHSLDKNHFSNYFLMGGERFEVNDPDYLFGDTCDLNFLSCTKPYTLPYKQAQKNLLSNLNSKHKAANKVSSRVSRLSSPFNILTGHHREPTSSMKQDANKQQLLHNSRGSGSEPSKPIVMFVNIRKETLRLVNSCNIEFYFDAEVDCSISIFYFCTRETTSNGITYRPQQGNHKSEVYRYKKGLNQKFDQQDHTIQPCKFDEDLLTYKPLDEEGNYNSGSVFPLVIHCVALDGSSPRQSHSLVATIEKRQLDESYSIKALKQLIFVDGVQYILQDIYGIEHKQITSNSPKRNAVSGSSKTISSKQSDSNRMTRALSNSVISNLDNISSNLNLSDTASLSSVDFGGLSSRGQNRGSIGSNHQKSLVGENAECVICMSEERDTMLLPCRHLCLCSSCAQSLRFQASSCPICRCPFKAALNFRPILHGASSSSSTSRPIRSHKAISSTELDGGRAPISKVSRKTNAPRRGSHQSLQTGSEGEERQLECSASIGATTVKEQVDPSRRESFTNSATPLLSSRPAAEVVISVDSSGGCNASTASSSSYWSLNTNVNVPTGSRNDATTSTTAPTAAADTSSQLEMKPMKPFA